MYVVQLSMRDALLTIASSSLITHLIFKRWDPADPVPISVILVLFPAVSSYLLLPHFTLIPAIFLSFLSHYAFLVSSIVLYRLSPFHPLARYPGPAIGKTTQLWLLSQARKGKRHLYIQDLHNAYGDIVRIGPNELSIRDVSVVSLMMGTMGLPKGPSLSGQTLHEPMQGLIALRDPVEHARRRKPWTRGFSVQALKEYEPVLVARVHQFVDILASHKVDVDFAKYISYFAYDFMGDMAFGGGSELMRDGDSDGLWSMLEEGISFSQIFEHLPWLAHFARRIPFAAEKVKKLLDMALARAEARRKQGSSTKDLFYYLNNDDSAEPISPSPDQVVSEGLLVIIAGADTTSAVLSHAIYFLLSHPESYKRLQAEIDQYYPPGEDALDTKHYSDMKYLQAVIDESLRLLPPVLSGSQRAPMTGSGGKVIGPYFIPEGTQARIHFYSVHRDPRHFSPNPDSFWPDRWLIADGTQLSSEKVVHNLQAFIPFSFGPYNCVGKQLAYQEMKMVLCMCLQKLEMRFADGWDPREWEQNVEDMFVTKKGRLPIVVSLRDGA